MAKKPVQLTRSDIILGADAETIRAALEARMQVDELLVARWEAYQKIAELEQQVETAIGEEGLFSFPEPPLPVAGWSKMAPTSRAVPKPPKKDEPADAPEEPSLDDLPEMEDELDDQ